jgi:hypothetical protein
LDGAYVCPSLQQVGGKRVSEGVAARRLCHPRGHHGPANLFLNDRAIEVVAPLLATGLPQSRRQIAEVQAPHLLQMADVLSSCSSTFWSSAGVITTGTRRFTLARTTPLRSPGSTSSTRLLSPTMQPDQGRGLALLKLTVHSIPDLALQPLQAACLGVEGRKRLCKHAGTRHAPFASHAVTVSASNSKTHDQFYFHFPLRFCCLR